MAGDAAGRHRGPSYADPGVRRRLLERALGAWPDPEPLRCVCVGDDLVIVHAPPGVRPGGPWRRSRSDGAWRVAESDLVEHPAPRPEESAVLVPVGSLHAHDVLMDLRVPAGPVAVDGDPAAAARVLDRMVRHLLLAEHPGEVVVIGRPVVAPWPRRGPTLLDSVATLERRSRPSARLVELGLEGLVRGERRSLARRQRVVVMTRPPTPAEEAVLADVDAVVVALGPVRHARWRLHVGADGSVEDPVLGLRLRSPHETAPDPRPPADPHSVPAGDPAGCLPVTSGHR